MPGAGATRLTEWADCLDASLPDLSRRQAGWLLALLLFGTALIRIALLRYIPGPFIFTDELLYVELARGFFEGHRMLFEGRDVYFPAWLYPALIAPLVAVWPMAQAHAAILGLNALVGSLTVLPVYFWARELTSRRRALVAAGLVALLPGLGYSGLVMTECLFLPSVTLALWLTHRAILRPSFEHRLAAGVAAGLCFQVKPQALLLPWIIAGTLVWFESGRVRGGGDASRAGWLGFAGALARHWATALGWALGMTPRLVEVFWLERPGELPTIQSMLGMYLATAVGEQRVGALRLAVSLAGYCAGWALTTGLWPAWYLAREVHASLALRNERAFRLLSQLTTVATLAMLTLSTRHTLAADQEWRLHERYFFVMLPPALILFAARAGADPGRRRASLVRWLFATGVVLSVGWIAYLTRWHIFSDSPTLAGLLTVIVPHGFSHRQFMVVWWIAGAVVVTALLFAGGSGRGRLATVALLLLWLSAGWYGANDQMHRQSLRDPRWVARHVRSTLARDDRLLVLCDGLPAEVIWHVRFHNPGRSAAVQLPIKNVWWAVPIDLAPDLRVLSPFPQERTWLLAGLDFKFNKPPVETLKNLGLYKLSGEPPLRFDPAQPLPARLKPPEDADAARRPELANLRLTVREQQLPRAWSAGESSRVRFRMRNDSLFTLPESHGWRIGYRWVEVGESGKIRVIVLDDGYDRPLPGRVAPGEEFDLHLDVAAPLLPGKWWLVFQFLETGGGRRQWLDQRVVVSAEVAVRPRAAQGAKP